MGCFIQSLKISWIKRYISSEGAWTYFLQPHIDNNFFLSGAQNTYTTQITIKPILERCSKCVD
jgi:hypothetical protein